MIPLVARVRASRGRRSFRLWIPLVVLWIVLLPVILLLLPVFGLACIVRGVRPFRALRSCWSVMNALSGTHIETANGTDSFAIIIH